MPSSMEPGTRERKRGHSSGSAPTSADILEQRQAKSVKFKFPEEPSRDTGELEPETEQFEWSRDGRNQERSGRQSIAWRSWLTRCLEFAVQL